MGRDKTPEYRPVKDAHKTLGLWSIRRALTFAFTAAVVLLVAAWFLLSLLLGSPPHAEPKPLETKDLLELLKLVFALVAGVGALVALVTAYRRQRVDEAAGERAERVQAHVEYGQGVELLGHDKAAVRLGGLYSLERLAQDHPYYRQTVIDVVCSYLRMPFRATPAEHDDQSEQAEQFDDRTAQEPELQVRLTAQRLLKRHLTVTEPGNEPSTFWDGIDIDLTGAHLIHLDFTDCRPASATFTNAHFSGEAKFRGARFIGQVRFDGAQFGGDARFGEAQFGGSARFEGAQFRREARFAKAQFAGPAGFEGAQFGGDARFGEAQFGEYVGFEGAQFSGNASFSEAQFGVYAVFEGTQFGGEARFGKAHFRGSARFEGTRFSGDTRFEGAQFGEYAVFDGTQFGGHAVFNGVKFGGDARFGGAHFEHDPDFDGAMASYPIENHVWPSPWRAQRDTADGAQLTREN
ncbi:pentapeptide repeat-containing protein [Actinomadura livida]|uniref:Uncharacterized protein YjbI with pentapeptide repeats n=1 Tax=Actinomadura livida TaxID=79909 RepID=A0A7W7IIK6_9ACTN|nr:MULTISPECIES: pentapeptide repeat-containing protein [Actinomadura]MBB4777689.1 uncharacterized protein YjbI with pentapeptide repeats [Actinomadura catellatispora]